jgi:hypothetical protein
LKYDDARHLSSAQRHPLTRRSLLRLGVGVVAVSLAAPVLAACGDDDDGDDSDVAASDTVDDEDSMDDDELEDALEQVEDETDAEFDATNGEDTSTFPDDFPDDVPLPDDWEIITDLSSDSDEGREIYIAYVSNVDWMSTVETFSAELEQNYEIDNEDIQEETEEPYSIWDFHGNGWESARISLGPISGDHDGEFQVLVELRDYVI